ncbi:MAG: zinc ribbon domain-containing protein [Planctomycetota bacterium]
MPTYEYFCPDNGQSLEVMHGMTTTLNTWGELCDQADLDPGDTPADTPIEKLLGTGMLLSNSRADLTPGSASNTGGGCCGGGGCGCG